MIFAWDAANREHIAKHDVSPEEAEEMINDAASPYPMEIGDNKLIVWGATRAGRYLQVVYVLKAPDEVEYGSLASEDWMEIDSGNVIRIVRVIHAMELTPAMKRRFRRRRR